MTAKALLAGKEPTMRGADQLTNQPTNQPRLRRRGGAKTRESENNRRPLFAARRRVGGGLGDDLNAHPPEFPGAANLNTNVLQESVVVLVRRRVDFGKIYRNCRTR